MGKRLSKIVTRTGDDGSTGLADGCRLLKSHIRVQCLGEVDELNAIVGLCISHISQHNIEEILLHIQHDLFDLGAELCQPSNEIVLQSHVQLLEQYATIFNEALEPLTEFILPGGSVGCAQLHLARTVCRRVERSLVELNTIERVNPVSLMYLNRLSDLFFILSRTLSLHSGYKEIYWQSRYSRIKP